MVDGSLPVPTVLEVEGRPLPTQQLELLTLLRVETAVNLVGRLTLRFADVGYQLSGTNLLKIDTLVQVKESDTQAVLFTGTVDSIALDHSAGHVPELVVTAADPTGALARARQARTFEQQPVSEILRKLASEIGCSIVIDGALQAVTTPYLLQTGTGLALLDEVVRANGGLWWFEPPRTLRVAAVADADADGTAVPITFADADGSDLAQRRLLTFSVRATGGLPVAATVTNWRGAAQNALTGTDDSPAPAAESAFVRSARAPQAAAVQLVTNAGDTADIEEASRLARGILGSARSDVVTGRGTALVDPRIRPNVDVEVTGAGPSSGKYRVTRVEHLYDRRGFHTTFHTGSHRPRGLVDTLAGGTGLPDARIDGVLCGIVADLKDPEKWGRVRVTFPALQQASQRDVLSNWARVATFDAGSGRGATFLPEVGDEVLVAFEGGSTRFPVVIGAMFSAQRQQPELGRLLATDGTKVKTRRLTSRTGHALEMVDEQGEGLLLLKHGVKPMKISMDEKSETLTVEATSGKLVIGNGQATITLDKNGDITLTGTKINVKGTTDVLLDAGTSATLKAKVGMTVEGVNTTVKGTAVAKLEGGASTTISGGMVAIN